MSDQPHNSDIEELDNDDEMVGRILNRREVLAIIGAVGTTFLIGCSSDSSGTPASTTAPAAATPSATATTQAADAATTATATPQIVTMTPTPAPAETTATTTTPATSTPAVAAASTAQATASATATAAASETVALLPSCVVVPELTEGPYFVDTELERSDIRVEPTTGETVEGMPLRLVLSAYEVSSAGCLPVAGVHVDVWQCDALGVYSGVSDPGFDTAGLSFLRGYQVTDATGATAFTTIYPGWYQGRAVHIHFKLRGDAGSGQSFEFTSQFFFDEAVTDEVHANEPYASKGYRTLLNDGDGIYQNGGSELLLSVTQDDDGYLAMFEIGLARE